MGRGSEGNKEGLLPNRTPEHVYMIAVCGTGMGALALLFREAGVRVSGSDVQAYPPMGDMLRKAGVELSLGYRAENVPETADFVVVGNAVSRDNPEVAEIKARGLAYGSFPESLAHFFLARRFPIVVTGTHGKTTSTALIAWLLACSGAEPGFLVGGEPKNFGSSSRLGKGKFFVVEGDEYDSAFFDKGPKFLHYRPRAALFTSIEFDHADIYPDLASIREQFLRFVKLLPPDGVLLVCNEYPNAVEIARRASCRVETYGYGEGADWVGELEEPLGSFGTLAVSFRGRNVGTFPLPFSGRHNGLNALGCLGVLARLGFDPPGLRPCLERFEGVRRRQEIAGEVNGVLLMDDFAHHPTAVRETLWGIRRRYPGRRIVTVFEPRTNTSRRKVFQGGFAEAFALADVAMCAPLYRPETVPPQDRFDPSAWVEEIRRHGGCAFCFDESADLERALLQICKSGDVVLFMSSGSFATLLESLKAKLRPTV